MAVKYYAVKIGRVPGIYNAWAETEAQVKGFPGSIHKSFTNQSEAEEFVTGIPSAIKRSNKLVNVKLPNSSHVQHTKLPLAIHPSISVDAACSGNPGVMEYRAVDTQTGKVIFSSPPIPNGTNNIGEYLALVYALRHLEYNRINVPIYTDSLTAIAWLKRGNANTTLKLEKGSAIEHLVSEANEIAGDLYNKYKNKIIKWDTKKWGEIPADYGRK